MEHNLENESDNGYNLQQNIKGTCTQSVAFYKKWDKKKTNWTFCFDFTIAIFSYISGVGSQCGL